ncbi:glycosyl transferase [Massilia sp. WF1]|nr:glycosyl transferase [Massilia sp. WG5]KLU37635.1 glycosyl transferase [Massilia sp. WF1]
MVPPALLRQADKILFIAHLALGDFAYLQSGFQAFARAYPHLKIHLWVDERRRTSRASEWPHLKKYALYDWLAECPYIDKVYAETYSPQAYRASLEEARREDYPVVVSLAVLERHKYALMARSISPHGFVVGQKKRVRPYDLPKHLIYRKLDAFIPPYSVATHPDQHISDIYAGWFDLLFGLDIPPAARFPVLDIADKWIDYARTQFADWGFMRADGKPSSVVFVNGFSKSVERSWPLERIIGLIRTMRCEPDWCDAGFVVNVVPEELARARELFAKAGLERSFLFSAEDNFFQLPAILSLCELIISVETAVMHLANAVHVPVIALMRQSSPEWVPIDKANSTVITAPHRKDWVDKIGVQDVMAVLAARRP